jgi:ergothioneine biosynthesis protein EgtB
MLSRPSMDEVRAYRARIDGRMIELLSGLDAAAFRELRPLVELGLAHEEQHQELMLTDILNAFSENPIRPVYRAETPPLRAPASPLPLGFASFEGGLAELGVSDRSEFSFDSESPRHKVWLEPFALANRLCTVGEMKAFIRDGGYRNPQLWLSEAWDFVRENSIEAPLYARVEDGAYVAFTLDGERELRDDEPIQHVSFYEADALARFLGARLPTEAEWESVAARVPVEGVFYDDGALTPRPASSGRSPVMQLFGDVWEWTQSAYAPYPGYRAAAGALGEYNGKFMIGQMVLRGGSCFTPRGHVRATYRNFWHPNTRFQMAGIRLAKDLAGARS